jgi:hypothetical protein
MITKLPRKLLLIGALSMLVLTVTALVALPAMADTSTTNTPNTVTTQVKPTVTGVTPASGNQGQTYKDVTLTGSGFTGATAVSFGRGIDVTSFIVSSDTSISADIVIANRTFVGSRFVTVVNPSGKGTDPAGFTVVKNAPTVAAVNPNTGSQGATLTGVVLTGTNFSDATSVSFGRGIDVTGFTVNSDTQITANIVIANRTFVGTRFVTVVDPSGHGTMPAGFTVSQDAPIITSLSITTGSQGATINGIVLTGTNFTGATAVSFGRGIDVTGFTVNSAGTQITANIVIANRTFVGSRFVTVVNQSGHGTLPAGFTVTKGATSSAPSRVTTTTTSS